MYLRAPISTYIGQRLDRSFAINGDLKISLFNHPHVEMNDVVLGNAPWGSAPAMVSVERAVIGVELLPIIAGPTGAAGSRIDLTRRPAGTRCRWRGELDVRSQ